MNHQRINDIVLMSAAPGLLLLGLTLDIITRAIQPQNLEAVAANTRFAFLVPMLEILLMTAIVGLIWIMTANRFYGRAVSVFYLVVGLLCLYAFGLYFVAILPESFVWVMLYLTPETFTYQAGGALAALGLVSLWYWRRPDAAPDRAIDGSPGETME